MVDDDDSWIGIELYWIVEVIGNQWPLKENKKPDLKNNEVFTLHLIGSAVETELNCLYVLMFKIDIVKG